jgi:hypothetical protein
MDAGPSHAIRFVGIEKVSAATYGAASRYTAVELRRCIEPIVYEELKVYDIMLSEGFCASDMPNRPRKPCTRPEMPRR